MESLFTLLLILLLAFFWLIPILIIAKSHKVSGNEKVAWILLVLFVSWFAWVFYLLLAPLSQPKSGNWERH